VCGRIIFASARIFWWIWPKTFAGSWQYCVLPLTANTCPPITTTVAVHGKNNVKVILLGITSSWTRNPPEEWIFCWELPTQGPEIQMNNIGFCQKLPYHRQGIHQLIDADSHQKDQNDGRILRTVTILYTVNDNLKNNYIPKRHLNDKFT
jgi:hypothetical protein